MALVHAISNGNWSDPARWNTGVLPTAADVVRPNNFTVTIDVNVTVTEIRNDAGGGAVVGGSFTLNDGVTVTASNGFYGTYQNTGGHGLLVYAGSNTVTINGNLNGSQINVSLGSCLLISSTGTANVNGNLIAAAGGANANGIRLTSTGTIILNGTISLVGAGTGIRNEGNGNVVVNNNITVNTGTAIINTSGIVTITGNITANAGTAIANTSGTVTLTGDITASTTLASNMFVIQNTGSGIINVIGNLIGGFAQVTGATPAQQFCITNTSSGTINVTGNVTSGSVSSVSNATAISACILNSGTGTVNVTGTVTNGSSQVGASNLAFLQAIRNTGTGIINIIGNCVGTIAASTAHQSAALVNVAFGVCNITGNAIGGSTGLAVGNAGTGTLTLNGNAIGGTAFQAIEGVNAAGNTIIEKAIYTAQGQSPISGYIKFKTTNPEIDVLREDAVIVTLRDPLNVSGLLPSPGDVRSGTTYSNGSSTGTLAMPAANLVQLGVPVDNTVGTGNLTPQDFWDYLISNGFVGGSIGERLKNASTVDTTGAQIASF